MSEYFLKSSTRNFADVYVSGSERARAPILCTITNNILYNSNVRCDEVAGWFCVDGGGGKGGRGRRCYARRPEGLIINCELCFSLLSKVKGARIYGV